MSVYDEILKKEKDGITIFLHLFTSKEWSRCEFQVMEEGALTSLTLI